MCNTAKEPTWQYCHWPALWDPSRSLLLPLVESHADDLYLSLIPAAAQKPNQRFEGEAVQLSFAQVADARLIGSNQDGNVPSRSLSCEANELARQLLLECGDWIVVVRHSDKVPRFVAMATSF
jgi:hypothetical protein